MVNFSNNENYIELNCSIEFLFYLFSYQNGYSLRAHTMISGKLLIEEIVFSLKLGKSFVFYFFSFKSTGDALGTICNIAYFLGSS